MAGPSASMDMDRTSIMKTGDAAAVSAAAAAAAGDRRLVAREAREDGRGAADASDERLAYQPLWVRLACIGLDFLTQTYDQIRIVPEIALFEQYVCRAHYSLDAGSLVSPELCKVHDVQYQLARLRSWKALFDGIAVLITAIPMGILADRIGRKKVIATSIIGPILQLCWVVAACMGRLGNGEMGTVWAGSIFLLMGNLSSANATIYAMAADSCPPSQRSRYFYYLYSTFLVCELIAPAFASATIERNLLIPFGLGLVCLLLCFPVLGLMPETHIIWNPKGKRPQRRPASPKDQYDSHETDPLLSGPSDDSGSSSGRSNHSLLDILRNRNILLALFILFIGALRQGTISVLLQYAAVRFGWPTSRTAMLVSAIAASNIVLFLFILPQTVGFLTSRWRILPQLIDYNIVSASLVILAIGSTFMGLAPSMTWLIGAVLFFAFGYGTRVAVLSLVTAWTDEDTRASTFGFAQIVEGTGRICGDPMLLRIFARSMQMEGVLQGLPFFVAAAGFSMASIAWRFVTPLMKSKNK